VSLPLKFSSTVILLYSLQYVLHCNSIVQNMYCIFSIGWIQSFTFKIDNPSSCKQTVGRMKPEAKAWFYDSSIQICYFSVNISNLNPPLGRNIGTPTKAGATKPRVTKLGATEPGATRPGKKATEPGKWLRMRKNSVNMVYKTFSHSPGFSLSAAPDFSSFSQATGILLCEKNCQ
jgi:hypothetical protein